MSNDTFNDLLAADAAAFKFEQMGDKCEGKVVRAERRQQTDLDTGLPKTFPSGDPMMMLVVTIDQKNGDGETAIYAKGGKWEAVKGTGQSMLDAIRTAVQGQEFRPGGDIAVEWTGEGKKAKAAFNAPKLYTVQYKAPAINLAADEDLF